MKSNNHIIFEFIVQNVLAVQILHAGTADNADRVSGALPKCESSCKCKNQLSRTENLEFDFNEWIKAQDSKPMGQDWQIWSASMYLYAAKCVEEKRTPFFSEMRQ